MGPMKLRRLQSTRRVLRKVAEVCCILNEQAILGTLLELPKYDVRRAGLSGI